MHIDYKYSKIRTAKLFIFYFLRGLILLKKVKILDFTTLNQTMKQYQEKERQKQTLINEWFF